MSVKKTIARSFTVETIEDGISVQAQYAPNANPTSSQIHNVWQDGDLFMRTRETDSTTWSAWHRIVGENGGETDYSFGISQYRTTENAQTAPSDISSWSDAPLAVTTAKPYLWSKVQQKSWNESTQQYVVDSTRYIRLTGEEGVVYDIQTPVDSIHIGENQTSATLSGTAKFYKKEGTKDKVQTVFYYGVYKRTGTTFAKVATGNANSYAFSNLSVANTVNAVVIYLFASSYTGTDPESQTYLCKREMLVVDAGNSPYFADLDNEMDSIACANDGKPSSEQTVETNVKLYRGSTALSPTLAVKDDSPSGAAYTSGTAKDGITVTWNNTTGNIKFKFGTSNSRTKTETFCITLSVTDNGATITRYLYFTVNCIRAALDGNPAALYRLVPSVNEIVKKKDGSYVPTGTSYITCGVTKNVGGTQSTPAASEYTLKYSLNGGSETTYTATSVKVNQVTSNLVFILYVNGIVVDRETIGIINDGIDGTSPYFADLDNEMDSIACNADGSVASAQTVSTVASMFHGSSAEPFTADTIKRNGTSLTWNGNNSGVWPRWNNSTKTLSLEFDTNASIADIDVFELTVKSTNDNTITRKLHFTINGVRANAIYRLVPSVSSIIKKKDGTYNPSGNVTCSVVKIESGAESTPDSSEYTLKKSVNGGSEVAYSATAANTITSDLKFILYVGGVVVDKETIPLVSDGDQGYSIVTSVTRNNFTEAEWETYGTVGHEETWTNTSSIRNGARVGDLFTVVGTATDTGNGHTATYRCTNSSGNLSGICISHEITLAGDDGVSPTQFSLNLTGVFSCDPNTQTLAVDIKGKCYRTVGGNTYSYNPSRTDLSLYFLKEDGTTDAVPNINNIDNGYTVSGSTFATKFYNDSGYAGEEVFVAVLSVDGVERARASIGISWNGVNGVSITGPRGKVGRFYYYAGEFNGSDSTTQFVVNDAQSPYFLYNNNYWVYNPENNPSGGVSTMYAMGTPSSSSANWKIMTSDFKYIITEAIFGQYAHFGKFIINGDWLVSTNGKIDGSDYNNEATISGSTVGGSGFSTKAYTLFDSSNPMGNSIAVAQGSSEVTIATSETLKTITTSWLSAGITYRLRVTGKRNGSQAVYVRIRNDSYGTLSAIYFPSTTYGTYTTIFRVITSATYTIELYQPSTGGGGAISSYDISKIYFAPNFAVDGLTGRSYQINGFISGFVRKTKTKITTSNINQYKRDDIASATVLDFDKCGSFIELSTGTYGYLTLPLMSNYLASKYTASQIDDIRSFVGTTMLIYNKSGQNIPMTLRYNSDGSTTSGTLHNGNCVELECCLDADENDGKEIIYWKVISYAEPVN